MTTILVGETPGDPAKGKRNGRPFDADSRSGRRLAEVFGVEDVSKTFATVNLVDRWNGRTAHGHAFPAGLARENALALWRTLPTDGTRIVFVGKRVAKAFDFVVDYLTWVEFVPDAVGFSRQVAVFPHPSGVNRWWNDPKNVRKARRFARAIVKEEA